LLRFDGASSITGLASPASKIVLGPGRSEDYEGSWRRCQSFVALHRSWPALCIVYTGSPVLFGEFVLLFEGRGDGRGW
jgi:hypothetical protein